MNMPKVPDAPPLNRKFIPNAANAYPKSSSHISDFSIRFKMKILQILLIFCILTLSIAYIVSHKKIQQLQTASALISKQ